MTGAAPEPAPPPPTRAARRAWTLLLALAALATLGYLFGASQRVPYPYELAWMEGAMADHAARVADSLPLYTAPSADHVSFLYSPLFFWLGGLCIRTGLDGLLALRLLALGFTFACAALIGVWVRRDTGRTAPGLVAAGLFVGAYGWLWWWFDLARNDTLFVFLCLATVWQLLHGGRRRWLWAGLCACLALLAKQSTLMWLPLVGLAALCHDWRTALRFGLVATVSMALSLGALHLTSDGWSTFFVFEMPRHHGWIPEHERAFWSRDLLPVLPLLGLSALGVARRWRHERGHALVLLAFAVGGLLASWFSRMHVGGFDNVLLYGYAAACVLGPIAVARLPRGAPQFAGLAVLGLQFAALGWVAFAREPARTLLPSAGHRHAHDQLQAFVARQDGPVWLLGHGWLARRTEHQANGGVGAHAQAIFDLVMLLPAGDLSALQHEDRVAHLSARARTALSSLRDDVARALAERRYAAIVLDAATEKSFGTSLFEHPHLFGGALAGADGERDTADDPYVRAPGWLVDDPDAITSSIGLDLRFPYALQRR